MSRQISDCTTRDEELTRQLLWVEHDAQVLAECAEESKHLKHCGCNPDVTDILDRYKDKEMGL